MIRCCKDCDERYIGCHGKCERYIVEKEEHQRQKDQERKKDEARLYKAEWSRTYLDNKINSHRKFHKPRG